MAEERRGYAVKLEEDLAEQFRGRPHNRGLLNVIGRQLDDIFQFFTDLRDKRSLMTAEGQQLDGIGDIVKLTRGEAGELACVSEPTYVLDDEKYRDLLAYKIWRNTNDTTYYDIIKSMRIFWDRPLYYSEDPEIPACMIFDTGEMEGLVDTSRLMLNPIIRAAGVGYRMRAVTSTPMDPSVLHVRSGFATWSQDQLEFLEREMDFSTSVHWFNNYPTFNQSQMEALDRLNPPQSSIMETRLGDAAPE